jgi:recombination protein RecT
MQAQDIIPSTKTALKSLPPKQQVRAMLEQNKDSIAKALPRHLSAERLLRVAQTACTTTPELLKCYTPSLVGAIIQCATMGLEPNTVLGHAYLVPFWNSKKKRKDAQVIIGYKGLVDLARRSGQIISVAAHAVYEPDEFDFQYGLEEKLNHRPARGDRGEIVAFYAVAKMKEGGHAFEVMWREEVDTIRDSSQNAYRDDGKGGRIPNKASPWWDHYESMGRKTVLRRLSKYLPLSVEFATAISLEEVAESGKSQRLDTVLEGEYAPSFGDEDDTDSEQAPAVATIDKPKINARKETAAPASKPSNSQGSHSGEPSPLERNPDLVNAILQALTDSVTEEEILEAEDLIRELEHPEDKSKCEQALEHKRKVMARSQPA